MITSEFIVYQGESNEPRKFLIYQDEYTTRIYVDEVVTGFNFSFCCADSFGAYFLTADANKITVVIDHEMSVGTSVNIGFYSVIRTVSSRNERRVGVLNLNTRKSSMRNHAHVLFVKLYSIHIGASVDHISFILQARTQKSKVGN